jgi:hypothetical protein
VKISKEAFKSLVKECLLELLSEGLMTLKEAPQRQRVSQELFESKKSQYTNVNNLKRFVPARQEPKNPLPDTGDALLNSLIADTANTTLLEQASQELPSLPTVSDEKTPMLKEHVPFKPEEVFGTDTTSKWAKLAFSVVDKKNA